MVEDRNGQSMSYFGDEGRNQLEHMHGDFQQAQNQNLQQLITDAVQHQLASLNIAHTPSEDVRVSSAMDDFQQAQNQNLQQLITDAVQHQLASLNIAQTPSEDVRVSFAMDDKLKHAMQYQSKVEHVGEAVHRDTITDLPNIPLTQAALRRNAGIPSQSGSSRSQRSSDQDPSLISAGHRLTYHTDDTESSSEDDMDDSIMSRDPSKSAILKEALPPEEGSLRPPVEVKGSAGTAPSICKQYPAR
jgi:hypothetical protein